MSKLDGIKPGDRVRVTFEGVYTGGEYTIDGISVFYPAGDKVMIRADHSHESIVWRENEINAPTFQIERIEPPLKVGDRVRYLSNPKSTTGVIVAFDGPLAVIRFEPTAPLAQSYYDAVRTTLLVRL